MSVAMDDNRARDAAILAAWDNDERVVEFAPKFGVSIPRVYQIVAARGKTPGQAGRPRKADPDDVVTAVRAGAKPAEVARAMDISRGRVTQILNDRAPDLLQTLRAQREANLSPRTIKERELRERKKTAPPPPPKLKVQPKVDGRARPKDWKAATTKALKSSRTQVEAAGKLGISLSGLRRRLKEMNG